MFALLLALLIGDQNSYADSFRESEWTLVGRTDVSEIFVRLGSETSDGHAAWLRYELMEPQTRGDFNVASLIAAITVRCSDSHLRTGPATYFTEPKSAGRRMGTSREGQWQPTDPASVEGRATSMVCSGQAGPVFDTIPGRLVPPPPVIIPIG